MLCGRERERKIKLEREMESAREREGEQRARKQGNKSEKKQGKTFVATLIFPGSKCSSNDMVISRDRGGDQWPHRAHTGEINTIFSIYIIYTYTVATHIDPFYLKCINSRNVLPR